jgi:glycerophosphoryl diester phosphodiesterase
MTLNCAHRGNPAAAPESTIPAFESAVGLGVDMVEFDVHRLADGELAVMHDPTVDRCTDGSGELAKMTLPEVKGLDAGSWFGGRFAGTRVPTLREAIEAIPAPIAMNVHLKSVCAEEEGFERALLEELHDAGVTDRALIVHNHLPSLDRLRREAPGLEYCWLPMVPDGLEYIRRARGEDFRVLQPGHAMLSQEFCDMVHRNEMHANVFYADTQEDMERFIGWGIDGILTNRPAVLREVLRMIRARDERE